MEIRVWWMANWKEAMAAALWSKAMAVGVLVTGYVSTLRMGSTPTLGSPTWAASMQVRMGDREGHVSFTCHEGCV